MKTRDDLPHDGPPDDTIHPHELLSAFLDGELVPAGKAAVERHLRGCGACRLLLDDLRLITSASAAEAPPPIPADLASKIRRRLRSDAPAGRPVVSRRFWISPLPLSAVATVVIAAALLIPWYLHRPAAPEGEPPVVAKAFPASQATAPPPAVAPQPASAAGPAAEPQPVSGREPAPASPMATASVPAPAPPPAPPPARAATEDAATEDKERESAAAGRSEAVALQQRALAVAPADAAGRAAPGEAVSRVLRTTAMMAASPAKALRLITPAYRAEIVEDGRLRIEAEGYACAVTIPPAPRARSAGGETAEGERPARGPEEDPLALERLFGLAAAAPIQPATASRARTGEAATAETGRAEGNVIVLLDRDGGTLVSLAYGASEEGEAQSEARELGGRIERLIRERYRPLLESRCGPLPAALEPPG